MLRERSSVSTDADSETSKLMVLERNHRNIEALDAGFRRCYEIYTNLQSARVSTTEHAAELAHALELY
jgi:hypothetical protein